MTKRAAPTRPDMNLLTCFQVLMEERNVSRAAERLYLTQSAVSKQLTRLRDWFDDPLFERSPKGLLPTPNALLIAPKVEQILLQVESLSWNEGFEPALSSRLFSIEVVETAYRSVYSRAVLEALNQAPGIQLRTKTWNEHTFDALIKREVDFGIGMVEYDERALNQTHHLPQELESVELFRDHAVCLMRPDHPAASLEWNLEAFTRFRHIHVVTGGVGSWLLMDILSKKDIQLDIALTVPDTETGISICQNSDLLMCYPYSAVKTIIKQGTLLAKPVPLPLEPGALFLFWHKHFNTDPSHTWLRELFTAGITQTP